MREDAEESDTIFGPQVSRQGDEDFPVAEDLDELGCIVTAKD